MKKLLIIALTCFVAVSCSNSNEEDVSESITKENGVTVQNVNVEVFSKLIESNEGQLLDVRTPEEWEEGIISKNAIKMNFLDENFAKGVNTLSKNKPIYVYCKAGGRSAKAAKLIATLGFPKVYNLDGGITAWESQGRKIIE